MVAHLQALSAFTISGDHPMNIIKSNDDDIDIIKLINSVPLGKLPEIEKMIEEALEKGKED
ncbi:MAG: hypothetical protein ACOCWA_08855 [Bacteroidota bacterium]